MNYIDKQIFETYEIIKSQIKLAAEKNDTNKCLQKVSDLWLFMNRFRNCDLQNYFDEEIYQLIGTLNKPLSDKNLPSIKIFILFALFSFENR